MPILCLHFCLHVFWYFSFTNCTFALLQMESIPKVVVPFPILFLHFMFIFTFVQFLFACCIFFSETIAKQYIIKCHYRACFVISIFYLLHNFSMRRYLWYELNDKWSLSYAYKVFKYFLLQYLLWRFLSLM